jgi:hypothetical protein
MIEKYYKYELGLFALFLFYGTNVLHNFHVCLRYNSGGKQFSPVPTKHLSVQCDAVTIHSVFWSSARKQSAPVTNVTQLGFMNGSNPGVIGGVNAPNSILSSPLSNINGTFRR